MTATRKSTKFRDATQEDLKGITDKAKAEEGRKKAHSTGPTSSAKSSTPPSTPTSTDELILINAADVKMKPVQWLWKKRIVQGDLNVLFGPGKRGKGTLAAAVVAAVTGGPPLPGEDPRSPSPVVYFSGEDQREMVLVPRMRAAGAGVDGRWIEFVDGVRPKGTKPGETISLFPQLQRDMLTIEKTILRTGAKLLVVDPISAYLDAKDSHKESDVRQTITPLAKLAEKHGVTVLLIAHTNKRSDGAANHRMGGSVATFNAARSVLCVERDPGIDGTSVLATVDGNLASPAPSLRFSFEAVTFPGATEKDDPIEASKVVWGSESDIDAEELLASGAQRERKKREAPRAEDAEAAIKRLLADGPMLANDLDARLTGLNIAKDTRQTAKSKLGKKGTGEVSLYKAGPTAPWCIALSSHFDRLKAFAAEEVAKPKASSQSGGGPDLTQGGPGMGVDPSIDRSGPARSN